jgi:hypothetical protein
MKTRNKAAEPAEDSLDLIDLILSSQNDRAFSIAEGT